MRRLLSVSVTCIALLGMLASPAVAAPRVRVDCASDPASLVTAISAAIPGAKLVISGTCAGFLALDKDLTLVGATPDATLIGDRDLGVLRVSTGAVISLNKLTIRGLIDFPGSVQLQNDGTLTLRQATISGGAINAIRNTGNLSLLRSTVDGTHGKGDAPITNQGGTVTLIQSQITNNLNTEITGAISNSTGGTVTLIGSTVSGNEGYLWVVRNAGTMMLVNSVVNENDSLWAGLVNTGNLVVTSSVVSQNSARYGGVELCVGGCGGGIHNQGLLLVRDSSVWGNKGNSHGGGIYNAGTMALRDSVVEANEAGRNGGGIFNAAAGTATLEELVVQANDAALEGGGIFNEGALTLRDVIFLNNTPNDCSGC